MEGGPERPAFTNTTILADLKARPTRSALHRCGGLCFADEAELAADAILDRPGDVGVFLEELLRVLAALAEALPPVREPGARLLNDPFVDRQIDEIACARDAFTVHDVELGFT